MTKNKLYTKAKKLLSIFLLIALSISIFSTPIAHAAYFGETLAEVDNAIMPYSYYKPDTTWNWNDGIYKFSGSASRSDLYTNHYFTDATTFHIYVKNNHSTQTLTVKLLRSIPGIDFSASTKKIEPGKELKWDVEVTPTTKYLLKFYAPCEFEGYIYRSLSYD